MTRSLAFALLAAAGLGVLIGWFAKPAPPGGDHAPPRQNGGGPAAAPSGDNAIRLSAEQIAAAKIDIAPVGPGFLTRRTVVPAAITPDPDKVGRVAAKVVGTIAEMRKKLGDRVGAGEVVAVVDSREVADAKSEFLAASVNYELQSILFQREKGLFEKKITAEQLFLKAKATYTEARLRLDVARQKLASLDLSEAEIANLSREPVSTLRRKEIRSPLGGRVIERRINLGQPVGGEGQTKELYVVADLSVVEAELAVPAGDLSAVREGQTVRLTTPDGRTFEGKVAVVSAIITPETRAGHVIARFENPDFVLRPGSLLNAEIALAQSRVKLKVSRAALQTANGETIVFVRTKEGFETRKVVIGAQDDDAVEIVSGLAPGERIAVGNTFVLKADLGKGAIPEE
jgi:cobalt-zinc-cadmium efflux system membrane fusion protein